jgi:hypothetical protein
MRWTYKPLEVSPVADTGAQPRSQGQPTPPCSRSVTEVTERAPVPPEEATSVSEQSRRMASSGDSADGGRWPEDHAFLDRSRTTHPWTRGRSLDHRCARGRRIIARVLSARSLRTHRWQSPCARRDKKHLCYKNRRPEAMIIGSTGGARKAALLGREPRRGGA